MSITNKGKAKAIKAKNKKEKEQALVVQTELSAEFHKAVDAYHGMDDIRDNELDIQFLTWKIEEITDGKENLRGTWEDGLPTFSPSGVADCERGLALKILEADKDEVIMQPYQKRWVKNGSAIHDRMQRDLLYMEKHLENCPFEVLRTKEGKPAWERNTRTVKQFEHKGVRFQIYGMVDGMLFHKATKKRIGYDFKTKSTTVATVGDFKLKVPQENNLMQMVAYALLFEVDEYIIHYESLAKDAWNKGKEARNDMKIFHIQITEEMKTALLDKLAGIVMELEGDELPNADFGKCLFCTYKEVCSEIEKEKHNG